MNVIFENNCLIKKLNFMLQLQYSLVVLDQYNNNTVKSKNIKTDNNNNLTYGLLKQKYFFLCVNFMSV